MYCSDLQHHRRASLRKQDPINKSDKLESYDIDSSTILEQPENYLPLKNIKQRLSRMAHNNNEEEDSRVVDRLKRIYMPEAYRKAKLRSRMNQKTSET